MPALKGDSYPCDPVSAESIRPPSTPRVMVVAEAGPQIAGGNPELTFRWPFAAAVAVVQNQSRRFAEQSCAVAVLAFG